MRWFRASVEGRCDMSDEPKVSARHSFFVAAFYLVASLVLTWPLARDFGSHLPAVGTPYDPLLHVFLLGWGWQGLTTNPLEVFHAPIFHPEVRTLTYMDHMLGEAVLGGPVIEAFGLGVAYNCLIILSFVASGYFVYRLVRLYGISPAGSCVAGFLFAFSPFRFSQLGCLNQIQTQFIPLGIFFGVSFLRTQKTRYGVGAALTFAAQSYFGWYATFHLLVALAVLVFWEVLREPGQWRRMPWGKSALLALMSAAMMMPGALPYLRQKLAMPEFDRPFSDTVRLSADLLDYLRVNSDNILALFNPSASHSWAGFFPGFVASGLAIMAVVAVYRAQKRPSGCAPQSDRETLLERARAMMRRSGAIGYYPVLWISGFVLSLGPFLHVAGHRLWVPLPYALCYYAIPGFSSMRTPARFAVLVALATAVLAGLGFDTLRRRYPKLGRVFLVSTLIAAGALAWCPTLPFVAHPDRSSMPPVYSWLAEQPDSKPLLEVPVPIQSWSRGQLDLRRQMYLLYHGKPRLDGASGFTSNRYKAFRRDMQAFPAPETIKRAYDMGARRLIVHYGDYSPENREDIRWQVAQETDLVQVAAFGQDTVYEFAEKNMP